MYCVFDCETSGLITPSYPFEHPRQGRILSVACILLDEQFKEVGTYSSLIRIPEHVEINEKAAALHGITKEKCSAYGVPVEAAIINIDAFMARSQFQIAHNIKFDLSMIHLEESAIFGLPRLKPMNPVCTMFFTTNICKLPSKIPGKFKWPKLSEAYKYLFNEEFVNGHDALNDVRATGRIFKWLVENNELKEPFKPTFV
jgi:DNA polymerase III epsilon subunit-like protein